MVPTTTEKLTIEMTTTTAVLDEWGDVVANGGNTTDAARHHSTGSGGDIPGLPAPTTATTATTAATTPMPTTTSASPAAAEGDGDGDVPTGSEVESFEDFEAMGLKQDLLRGIFGYGLEKPSAVQKKGIVPTAAGRDMLMQAQAGTGKTAAFSIGMLEQLDTSRPGTQALILSPTRDLALQTERVVACLGDYLNVSVHASIGGRSGREDSQALRQGPHVVTGTPGRVVDNIERGSLDTRGIRTLILDEVDVMLDEGFVEAVKQVTQAMPDAQLVCVSATFPQSVFALCCDILRDPVKIVVPVEELSLAGIAQYYIDCGSREAKIDVLLDLYGSMSTAQSVVFCNSRRSAMQLADEMDRADHTVSVIHGELLQDERDQVIAEFTQGASRVLIATDVFARGMDVQQVSLVINVELPHDRENYIHRIGRCGRQGRKGVAINLIDGNSRGEIAKLQELERFYSAPIEEMPENAFESIT